MMRDQTLLDTLLEPGGLTTLFQPILNTSGTDKTLHGLECLTRGPGNTNLQRPDVLFEYVRRKRQESLVDFACIETALRTGGNLPGEPRFSLNVHASTLGRDCDFVSFLVQSAEAQNIALPRLTIEIVEHTPFWDKMFFLSTLERLRHKGISIALDDVGIGQSNFLMILDSQPNYLKIDRSLVHSCHTDPRRLAVLECLRHLSDKLGAELIAEGVEEDAEFQALRSVGINLMQGYLFARPVSAAVLTETPYLDDCLGS